MLFKKLIAIGAGVVLFLFGVTPAFSQPPDPRDSIILESKTVAPGAHPGSSADTTAYLYIRVSITNKDSLTSMLLPLVETSTSGGAYAILAQPRSFSGVVNPLTNTLRGSTVISYARYRSNSPDTFSVAGIIDGADPATIEPPNASRKAFWELKFDSVWAVPGTFELDSVIYDYRYISFTNTVPQDLKVNFVKSVIAVAPKGDLDLDFALTTADATLVLNSIFLGNAPPAGLLACDLNCDGMRTPVDVVLELYAVFLSRPFPC